MSYPSKIDKIIDACIEVSKDDDGLVIWITFCLTVVAVVGTILLLIIFYIPQLFLLTLPLAAVTGLYISWKVLKEAFGKEQTKGAKP